MANVIESLCQSFLLAFKWILGRIISVVRMDANDSLRFASLWHSMHAISQQLSPTVGGIGIEFLEADTFDLHCFLSLTGTKFLWSPSQAFRASSSCSKQYMVVHYDLPQLRSITSMDLGCDVKGYSRAGIDTLTWYCVIVARRPGSELSKAREIMRSVQDNLTNEVISRHKQYIISSRQIGCSICLQGKTSYSRMVRWGCPEKKYCFFYSHSEDVFDTCLVVL